MAEKIKIFRLMTRLNIGGPAIQGAILTNAFNNEKFESVLVAGVMERGEEQMDFLLSKYGVKPIFIPKLKREIRPLADIVSLYRICKLMKQYRPDIVHTHTAKAGFLGRVAAFFVRVPIRVHTFHGHTFYGYFNSLKNSMFLFVERVLAKLTNAIIAISPLQHKDITETYKVTKKDKCEIIPLGLDLDDYLRINFFPKHKENIGLKNEDIVIGTVGRITEIKNHKLFLDIAQIFYDSDIAKNISVKFILIGGGELKDEIESYKNKLGLKDKVFLTGWQKNMTKIYSAMDIFVLTSKNEGTPISMIEAMASGIPAVSTEVGGVADVLIDNETGYLVNDFDKKDFVKKLIKLISDKDLRERMGKTARDSVKNKFSKGRLIRDINILYEKLIKERGK